MAKGKKARKAPQLSMSKSEDPAPPSSDTPDREAQGTILDLVARLHLNSDYSDLVIVCQGKTLPAHKLVVCPRSEYFRSACFGGFKEAKDPIRLDTTDPVLFEKVLEFLYTGNYTIGYLSLQARFPPVNSRRGLELDAEHVDDPLLNRTAEEDTPAEDTLEAGETVNETTTPNLDNIAQDLVHEKNSSDQEGFLNAVVQCHPSYFHLRIFGEADYFMISDLKDKAKEQFRASFRDCLDRNLFAEVIKELYSNRADYQELRKLAIDVVVDNLPDLRKGFMPAIDAEIVKTVPDFAIDLCLATLDKYVSKPPNAQPYLLATSFGYKGVQPFGTTNWSSRN